jgi:putative ABC transport system ATP-binding protein
VAAMSVLTLKDVTYKYGGSFKNVLKGISAEFDAGKVYTIVGRSGSGKSTLLSLLAGLDVSQSGEVLYGKDALAKIDRDEYRAKSIGVIFQAYNLITNATAVENIVLSMHISKSNVRNNKEFAYELLARVGIDKETADRRILQLSGGEQQRVGIARALSHNPDIIIADEPTGNLDKDTEADILKIFTALAHEEGKCIIIVTHSKKVTSIADEVLGINDGKISMVK